MSCKFSNIILSMPWLLIFLSPISMKATPVSPNATAIIPKNMFTTNTTTKNPDCRKECGNLIIPYPFGIGPNCSLNDWFSIRCDKNQNPPKAFLEKPPDLQERDILEITEFELVIRNKIASKCESQDPESSHEFNITGSPFAISRTANKLTVIGCNHFALIGVPKTIQSYSIGCMAMCMDRDKLIPGSCSGLGCCQTSIPIALQEYKIALFTLENQENKPMFDGQVCSYGFFARYDNFSFGGVSDLTSKESMINRTMEHVPLALNWALQRDTSCKEAKKYSTTYLCQSNTKCVDSDGGGYHCSCAPGYEGNPYLGCTDIDECTAGSNRPCSRICTNKAGSFKCSCPDGYYGEPCKKIRNKRLSILYNVFLGLAASMGTILLLLVGWCLHSFIKKRKNNHQKSKNFERNGGFLLQQVSRDGRVVERMKIFTADELDIATGHFNENRILGEGGYGTVYKGMLSEGKVVAIKKSNIIDKREVEQFINEIIILSQINHRHIVRLLGCCLETEVPLLVYEFIPNGTLFHHIHCLSEDFPITWKKRLQIAYNSAGALDYLHSLSSVPIFHRDIKPSNILLDDKYEAKIADFGFARISPIDQTHIITEIVGTIGYLDPEYFVTGRFTQKSDVYSFGVVLVELLTSEKAIRSTVSEEDRSLRSWFHFHVNNSHLLNIIDSRILQEGSEEEFRTIANLAVRCLNMEGRNRPTMNEVQRQIDAVRSLHYPPKNYEMKPPPLQESPQTATNGLPSFDTSSYSASFSSSAEAALLFNSR